MIRTKADYFARSSRGDFNQLPSWPSESEARASGYHGPVMIRSRTPDSPYMRPNVPMDRVADMIDHLITLGARREEFYLTWMSPCVGRVLNGELIDLDDGLYLQYSTVQAHLREALYFRPGVRHVRRSEATAILRSVCDPDSVDDLFRLLAEFPRHAIELTVYDRPIGTIPGRNVVIWEIRKY